MLRTISRRLADPGAVPAPRPRRPALWKGAAAGVAAGLAVAAVAAPPAVAQSEAPRKSQGSRVAANLPALPVLDPALNPDVGVGLLAAQVRERILLSLRLMFSATQGDVFATDGPITAEETPEGGAFITFPELTLRVYSAAGFPTLISVGDLEVGASNRPDGDIEYQYRLDAPITVFSEEGKVGEITYDTISARGLIRPDQPFFGDDSLTLKGISVSVAEDTRDPVVFTIGDGTLTLESTVSDSGRFNADLAAQMTDVGIAQGEHDPTIAITGMDATLTYDDVPAGYMDLFRMMGTDPRLPTYEQMMDRMGRVYSTEVLGTSEASLDLSGIEIYLSPAESVTFDTIGMEMTASEVAGGTPSGRFAFSLDGLRTRGATLENQVDLGALRMSTEGEGLGTERLRAFMGAFMPLANEMQVYSQANADAEMPEPPPPELMSRMFGLYAGLIRDMRLGSVNSEILMSGLNVRERGQPVFALERMELTGGLEEDERGFADGPSRLMMTGLEINDAEAGPPVSIGLVDVDTMTEDLDLPALREMAAQSLEAFQAELDARGVDAMASDAPFLKILEILSAINETATVAGGTAKIRIEDVAIGTDMNPMGGLAAFGLDFGMPAAAPGVDVTDATLSMDMKGLDLGPMAAMAAPPEIIPSEASFTLDGSRLPIPALSRMGMGDPMNPGASEADMEAEMARLLQTHRPVFDLESLTIGAPAYRVEGGGNVAVSGMMPQQVAGGFSLSVSGLDETMALLQERAKTDPTMQQPLLVLVALRGLARQDSPGSHLYDIEISPQQGVLINGTPAAALMMGGGAPPPQ
ncbi:hypothetical protein [Roseospira navarrensis]|uniref:DUF2125 domain-containing protein n=1 Tax=Roseospira navarrensis TaxID=140058 RepID=A0A7X2D5Q0_9PROT|nr:hypothetical protein [Roseospira navarrensis]MQX37465.1 hypothetical protein [Roseospira navarrensis]